MSELPSSTIWLLVVESIDQLGASRYVRDAYATKELADSALNAANARKAENEKRRMEKKLPHGTIEEYWLEECALIAPSPAPVTVSDEMVEVAIKAYSRHGETPKWSGMKTALLAALTTNKKG